MSRYPIQDRKRQKYLAQYAYRTGKISFREYHLALLPLYEQNN